MVLPLPTAAFSQSESVRIDRYTAQGGSIHADSPAFATATDSSFIKDPPVTVTLCS